MNKETSNFKTKKYSIIMPTLNEAEGIQDVLMPLQSLRTQCQIIIADAGSTDGTQVIAAPLVDFLISVPKGRALQMNAGADRATGNILIFLHADTYLPERALQLILQGIDAGALWGRFDIQLTGQHMMLKVVAQMMNWRSRLTGIATGDQVIFMTRQSFQKVGGYADIALMEDIDMCKRLKKLAPPYHIAEKVESSGRRWDASGVWKTIFLMWNLRLRYYLGESPDKLVQRYRK